MADGRTRRITHLILTGVIFELALLTLGHFGPALKPLLVWAYPGIAVIFAVIIWRARSRHGDERRHAERRHPSRD
jgi:hypothetical protein